MDVDEIAKASGLSLSLIRSRLAYGWTAERIIATPARKNYRKNILLTCNGVTKSIRQWAEDNGIAEGVIRTRLARGWNDSQAVAVKPKSRKAPLVISHRGMEKTISQWAEFIGTDSSLIRSRLNRGWLVHDAIEQPARKPFSSKAKERHSQE